MRREYDLESQSITEVDGICFYLYFTIFSTLLLMSWLVYGMIFN